MNCSDVQERLSEFHDRELASVKRRQLRGHLARCPVCTDVLTGYQNLTWLCRRLPDPVLDAGLWPRIVTALQAGSNPPLVERRGSWTFIPIAVVSIATAVLVFMGFTLFLSGDDPTFRRSTDHQMAVNFEGFLDRFSRDPQIAQQELLDNYNGKSID
ncbi:MAG: anti-sigma factor [Pirellulaceae bacterium]